MNNKLRILKNILIILLAVLSVILTFLVIEHIALIGQIVLFVILGLVIFAVLLGVAEKILSKIENMGEV